MCTTMVVDECVSWCSSTEPYCRMHTSEVHTALFVLLIFHI